MNGLKFHWSNPQFDGLPWACDKKKIRRRCCKVNYSLEDVRCEVSKLRQESPGSRWSFAFCWVCRGFHVVRKPK